MQKKYAESNQPKLSKKWKTREAFKGYPSNTTRVESLSFNPENQSSLDAESKISAFLGKNFFKNNK